MKWNKKTTEITRNRESQKEKNAKKINNNELKRAREFFFFFFSFSPFFSYSAEQTEYTPLENKTYANSNDMLFRMRMKKKKNLYNNNTFDIHTLQSILWWWRWWNTLEYTYVYRSEKKSIIWFDVLYI